MLPKVYTYKNLKSFSKDHRCLRGRSREPSGPPSESHIYKISQVYNITFVPPNIFISPLQSFSKHVYFCMWSMYVCTSMRGSIQIHFPFKNQRTVKAEIITRKNCLHICMSRQFYITHTSKLITSHDSAHRAGNNSQTLDIFWWFHAFVWLKDYLVCYYVWAIICTLRNTFELHVRIYIRKYMMHITSCLNVRSMAEQDLLYSDKFAKRTYLSYYFQLCAARDVRYLCAPHCHMRVHS